MIFLKMYGSEQILNQLISVTINMEMTLQNYMTGLNIQLPQWKLNPKN